MLYLCSAEGYVILYRISSDGLVTLYLCSLDGLATLILFPQMIWLPCILVPQMVWLPCILVPQMDWLPCLCSSDGLVTLYLCSSDVLATLCLCSSNGLVTLYPCSSDVLVTLCLCSSDGLVTVPSTCCQPRRDSRRGSGCVRCRIPLRHDEHRHTDGSEVSGQTVNLFVTQTPPDVYLPCLFHLSKFCWLATSADRATVSVCASHSRYRENNVSTVTRNGLQ